MALGALGPLSLEFAAQPEVAGLQLTPASLPVEAIVAADSGACHPDIDAHHSVGWLNVWHGRVHDDVQIPVAARADEISGRCGIGCILRGIHGNGERNAPAAGDGRQVDHARCQSRW